MEHYIGVSLALDTLVVEAGSVPILGCGAGNLGVGLGPINCKVLLPGLQCI